MMRNDDDENLTNTRLGLSKLKNPKQGKNGYANCKTANATAELNNEERHVEQPGQRQQKEGHDDDEMGRWQSESHNVLGKVAVSCARLQTEKT